MFLKNDHSSLHQNVQPPDYSGIPRLALHSHFSEHIDGLGGIRVCPECENQCQFLMYPRANMWWRSLDLVDKIGATLVISVYDRLFHQNVIFSLTTRLYNGIHFLVIGGVFLDSIRECLTMVCHQILMLSENCAHSIVKCININL